MPASKFVREARVRKYVREELKSKRRISREFWLYCDDKIIKAVRQAVMSTGLTSSKRIEPPYTVER